MIAAISERSRRLRYACCCLKAAVAFRDMSLSARRCGDFAVAALFRRLMRDHAMLYRQEALLLV